MTISRFVQWWQSNPKKAEEIKRRRREKYKENGGRPKPQDKKTPRLPKPRVYHHEGVPVVIWPVGRVAQYLGIHKRTLAKLEARGAIPTNRVIDDNRWRWWPEAYVKWLKPFMDERKTREITPQEFSRRVWNGWRQALASNVFPVLSEAQTHDQRQDQRDPEKLKCSLEDIFGCSCSSHRPPGESDGQDRR